MVKRVLGEPPVMLAESKQRVVGSSDRLNSVKLRQKYIFFSTVLAVIIAFTSLWISGSLSSLINSNSPQTVQPIPPVKVLTRADSNPILHQEHGDDRSTIPKAISPPSTVTADWGDHNSKNDTSSFLVPWPGSTFIIRYVASGQVMTLLDGSIVLTRPGGRGSSHWACVENKGWLGFRNVGSGKFLGHDHRGRLRCVAAQHQKWEYFSARIRPDGGCVLLMTHWEELWHVGIMVENGMEKLAKIGDRVGDGAVWEFVRV